MKSYFLSSSLSGLVIECRDKIRIIRSALSHPDIIGLVANRQLAYKLIVQLCEPGKVFVDVGSHVGLFVSLVSNHDSTIKIVGIEAMENKVKDLRRRFPNVTFFSCAAGNFNGDATFNIYPDRDGYSSLLKFLDTESEPTIKSNVAVRKLDDLLENQKISAMKLIIEGGELNALKGATNIVATCRPVIMFESSEFEDPATENTIDNRWDYFNDNKYQIFVPNRVAHDGPSMSRAIYAESHFYPMRTLYYIAVPEERRIDVRDKARNILGVLT